MAELLIFRPLANGTLNESGVVSADSNYEAVDEVIANDFTDYVECAGKSFGTNGDIDVFQFTLDTLQSGATINHVKVYMRFQQETGGTENGDSPYLHMLIHDGTSYDISATDEVTADDTWEETSQTWTTNPFNGDQPWTFEDLDNDGTYSSIQFGFERDNVAKDDTFITQMWVEISYASDSDVETIDSDAHIYSTDTKNITSDSYIDVEGTELISSDAHISVEDTATITSDAVIHLDETEWWDDSYHSRQEVDFGSSHDELPVGYTAEVKLFTGYEKIIALNASANEGVQHSAKCIQYSTTYDAMFFTWLAQPSGSSSFYVYTNRYDFSTNTMGTPYAVVAAGTSLDTHFASTLLIDSDDRLHLWYGSHRIQQKYARATNVNDHENWAAESSLGTATDTSTYPRTVEDDSGNLYCFSRGGSTTLPGADTEYFGFYKSSDKGVTWGNHQMLADYSQEVAEGTGSIYIGGAVYKNSRMHLVLTFWDGYGITNKGRRISYIYSDDFEKWYDIDGTLMADTTETYKVLQYSSGSASVVDSPNFPSAGPFYHTNTEGLAVDESHHPYFMFQEWTTNIREECDLSIAFHDGTDWTITNLSELPDSKQMYYYRSGANIIYDSGKLYCYAFIRPEVGVEYSGAEIYRWTGWNNATTWTHGQLTKNTADGIGMMSVLNDSPNNIRNIVYCRSKDVCWLQDRNYPKVRNDGEDVRVVRQTYDFDTDITTNYELDRLPDRFNAEDTTIFWELDFAVPENSGSMSSPTFENTYWIYYNSPLAVNAPNDPDNVFTFYDNFEAGTPGSTPLGWSGQL